MQAGQSIQNMPIDEQRRLEDSLLALGEYGGENTVEDKAKGGLKIRPISRIVWRNVPLILGVTALLGGLAYLNYKSTPLIYQGNFVLLVEPITSQARATDPTAISRAQVGQDNSTIDYPTLLQVLKSPELLSKIAAQIQTRYPEVSINTLARDLKNEAFVVQRIGTNQLDSTRTIQVAFQGADPQYVQFVLDQLAEGYLRFSLEDRKTRIGGGVEFIEDQLPGLQQRVNALESQIQDIRQRYRFTDPNIENQQVAEQLREVRKEKLQAETTLQEQATLYTSLQRQLGLSPSQGLAAASLSQNPRYQDLLAQLKKVESQIAVSLARYSEESPVVKRLQEQEANLNRLIAQEASRNLGQTSPGIAQTANVLAFQDALRVDLIRQLVTASNQTLALQARNNEILRNERELDQRLAQLPAIARQYNALQQQLDIATRTLNQFLLQRETLRLEAAQKEVPWEIISKPKLATDPETAQPIATRDKKARQLLMLGAAGGLILGFLAALLREKLRNVFVTVQDLQDAVPLPILSTIPPNREKSAPYSGSANKFTPPFAEAFNALYTNLYFLNPETSIRSLVISSVEPSDGKTTVALNLAQMAASMGKRVLLVDANLFAPQLHALLELPNQKGLTDLLRGKFEDVRQAIQPSLLDDRLSVLTSGPVQLGATKLFASNEMQRLVKELQNQFDLVIYDTPALDGVTDTNFLLAQTDGLAIVVGINKTKRSKFNATLKNLKKYRLPVFGVVANHSDTTKAVYTMSEQGGVSMPRAFLGSLQESSNVTQ